MSPQKTKSISISIGDISQRTGLSITSIRFYEEEQLVFPSRNAGGQRRFVRSDIRRLSFIKICQNLGFSLNDIRQVLSTLPENRTPNKKDWERLSRGFAKDIDTRIDGLTALKQKLSACIGCGCLSMTACKLYNPADKAAELGAGPRYLIGDSPDDLLL